MLCSTFSEPRGARLNQQRITRLGGRSTILLSLNISADEFGAEMTVQGTAEQPFLSFLEQLRAATDEAIAAARAEMGIPAVSAEDLREMEDTRR